MHPGELKLVDHETCYKGLIAELELHTLRACLTAGLVNKAQRGELALTLPVGLVRDALGRVLKHPDQEVRDRLALVFTSFLQVKSACQVVRFFNDRDLLLPRQDRFGRLRLRPHAVGAPGQCAAPARAEAAADGPVEGVPPGQVSGLHRLGYF
jgi:hypothetical protein